MIHKYITHRNAYIFGLLGMVFCLSISEYALSVFQFFMAANWLLEGNRLKRAKAIFSNHDAWLLTSLLALGVVGLLYTSNFGYALDDLRIKLPLFLLPFLWAGYKPLSRKELQVIFAFFVLGLIISAGFTLKNYHYLPFADYNNIRSISQFVSHIRFSLMLVLAVFLMPFYYWNEFKKWRLVIVIVTIGFLYTVVVLQSFSGIMVLCISSAVAIICWLMRLKNQKMVKMVVTTAFVSVLLGSGYLFYPAIKPFFKSDDLSQTKLPYHTPSGNIYYHNLNNKAVENGHLIWTYICWKELREEWQKKSDIPVDSVGKSGEQIMTTLIRFLTSKADPKDSSGVSKLDERQVVAIENGETNYYLMDEQGVRKRMYQISWEMHSYLMGAGNPEGNSAAQRFEFWKAAVHVLKKHWIIGVGTGDTYDEMKKAYQELESNLSDNYRLKPHNQYLTYWITYGILGFLLLIFIFVRPIFVYKYNYPYLIFAGILLSSMLVEDTIEGQIGLTFATVFYCLFSFASSRNLDSSEHEIPAEV